MSVFTSLYLETDVQHFESETRGETEQMEIEFRKVPYIKRFFT